MLPLPRAYLLYPVSQEAGLPERLAYFRSCFDGLIGEWEPFPLCSFATDGLSPSWYPGGALVWSEVRSHLALWEHLLSQHLQVPLCVFRSECQFRENIQQVAADFWQEVTPDWQAIVFYGQCSQEASSRTRVSPHVQAMPLVGTAIAYAINETLCYPLYAEILTSLTQRHWPESQGHQFASMLENALAAKGIVPLWPCTRFLSGAFHGAS